MTISVQQIHQFFINLDFQRVRRSKATFHYAGKIKTRSGDYHIEILFDDLLFLHPPKIRLTQKEFELPDLLAHISDNNALCYLQEGIHVLDSSNPLGTLKFCLEKVGHTIDELLERGQEQDLREELVQVWQEKRGYHLIPKDYSGRSACWLRNSRLWVARENEIIKKFPLSELDGRRYAYVIRLNQEIDLASEGLPETFEEFIELLRSCGLVITNDLAKCFRDSHPYVPAVFLNAPNGCIGVTVEPTSMLATLGDRKGEFLRNLIKFGKSVPITRFGLTSANWGDIMQRNLHGHKTLERKKIMVIGCGTIGSHLAKFLTQSGAGFEGGQLSLTDKELFEAGNIGRHLLGFNSIGQNKAEEVSKLLLTLYPEANIAVYDDDAIKLFPLLENFDLIIDATGDESFSAALNKYGHTQKKSGSNFPPIIFTFNLGNGDAAQSLFVDFDPKYACYKCLRTDFAKSRSKNPIRNDGDVDIVSAACGDSPYFPYGVAASAVSASLAIQSSLDWCNGDPSPRLRTLRLVEEKTLPIKNKNWEGDKNCPVCKS